MNTRGLLDQLLKSGQQILQQRQTGQPADPSGGASTDFVDQLGGLLGGSKGALGGGALAMLLASKGGRKLGGKALTYGGLAALGTLAYKAYGNWQAQQQATGATVEPKTVDRLPAAEAETHSQAILTALIAAAKADGHVDTRERELIEQEFAKFSPDAGLQHWLDAELNKPLDPVEVARAGTTPEMASEMYLASLLMVDEEQFMERAYLDELARQLKLPDALKAELERQMDQAPD
ncbi:tellurite resistance TerB family protein [Pseudomonas sp. Marseille-QA0892]